MAIINVSVRTMTFKRHNPALKTGLRYAVVVIESATPDGYEAQVRFLNGECGYFTYNSSSSFYKDWGEIVDYKFKNPSVSRRKFWIKTLRKILFLN